MIRSLLTRLARWLRPWFDLRTRRPLALLVGAALAWVLAPLAVDLFYVIPWRWRWLLGQTVFLGLMGAGLYRLWIVRPTDSWPEPPVPLPRLGLWLLRLAVLTLLVPLMRHPENLGYGDWDFFLEKYEAVRRTVLVWGQFPWWTPWCRGGFPLAAEPQVGVISIATVPVLLLGTSLGLRVAVVACLLLGVEGAFRLAWLWLREPWGAAAAALVYGLSGALSMYVTCGYHMPMSTCLLPWLVLATFRLGDHGGSGLALGCWMALAALNGIQYPTIYGVLIAGVVWLRSWRVSTAERRGRLLFQTAVAVATCLALAGWRFATTWGVMRDFPREYKSSWAGTPWDLLDRFLHRPTREWFQIIPEANTYYFFETVTYIGLAVLALAAASLRGGWRWWHTLAAVCGWLAVGSIRWYDASYWLSFWPLFSTMHVVTRWRLPALLGVGLAAGSTVAGLARSGRPWARRLAALLVLAIAGDYLALAHHLLPQAFSIAPDERPAPGPPVADIVNVRSGTGFVCQRNQYGVIEGYEPLISYRRDSPTRRLWRGHAAYVGEAWSGTHPVRPAFWSPNRIVFEVAPGQVVVLNQNPGSWWWVNGRPAFPHARCAEPLEEFVVRADAAGRIELRIRPRNRDLGVALHALGLTMLAILLVLPRRGRAPEPPS